MDPTIIEQPSLRVAGIRHIGPYTQIGQAFGQLTQALADANLAVHGPLVGIYHDNPDTTPAQQLRSDAGIVLTTAQATPKALSEIVLAAGTYACLQHRGAYDTLAVSWGRLREWIPAHPLRRGAGPAYELYRNTPMTAAPADLITEIYVPVVR